MKKFGKCFVVLAVLFAALAGCSSEGDSAATDSGAQTGGDPQFLTISAGSVGGGWYVLSGIIQEILEPLMPDTTIKVVTGGSVTNATKVSRGDVELGFTMDNIVADALMGTGPYTEEGTHANLNSMMRFGYINMSVFMVAEDSPYTSIQQIVDNKMPIKLVTAVQGSSPALATDRVLEAYGISAADIESWGGSVTYVPYSDGAGLMRDGHADVYCNPILPATLEMVSTMSVRLLEVDDAMIKALGDKYKYGARTIKPGEYDFINQDFNVITENPIVAISSTISDDAAYKIVKAICENPDKVRQASKTYANWNPEGAAEIIGSDIHPGALRYYKEMGYAK